MIKVVKVTSSSVEMTESEEQLWGTEKTGKSTEKTGKSVYPQILWQLSPFSPLVAAVSSYDQVN